MSSLEDYMKPRAGDAGLESVLDSKLREAYRAASSIGVVIGRVSRYSDIVVGSGSSVEVEVDPRIYYTRETPAQRVGDYVVIVDLKGRLVLARVTAIYRSDQLASLKLQPPIATFNEPPDPTGIITTTRIKAQPLLEAGLSGASDPEPASTSIEPQSPVVDPRPEVLARLLDLGEPGEGVVLGALATYGGLVKDGSIAVPLPFKAMLQHVLIIGTTGSGKTTLLKNMIADAYSRWGPKTPIFMVVDLNQDFIQLPFPPLEPPRDVGVYRNAGPVRGLIVVAPVSSEMIARGRQGPGSLGEAIARMYYRDALSSLVGHEPSYSCRRGSCTIMVSGKEIIIYYYLINTLNMQSDRLTALMPGLPSLSSDLLKRVRERFKRENDSYPPLQAVLAAIAVYLEELRSKQQISREDLIESVGYGLLRPFIIGDSPIDRLASNATIRGLGFTMLDAMYSVVDILSMARPHKSSLEALYRRLYSLLETGVVDVALEDGGSIEVLEEAGWEEILGEAGREGYPVVLDLRWISENSSVGLEALRLVAYRMLERVISWKHSMWVRRVKSRPVIIVIDEAHQFFPQESGSGEEREATKQVASMISRIARLGRVRGVGLVFSTHSPKDLHDIILQLANTKIALRTESHHIERLDLPPEAGEYIPFLPDRRMVVASHVYRGGYVIAHTSTPVTMHYDLSASI